MATGPPADRVVHRPAGTPPGLCTTQLELVPLPAGVLLEEPEPLEEEEDDDEDDAGVLLPAESLLPESLLPDSLLLLLPLPSAAEPELRLSVL